ncbi:GrpB family protein [Macrococcoides caseolyticum]|uniref:GrpB family protein n=1 Tax=Macrococcoides caseolyticum TaxID=69966 RepID=UPI001F20807D|nr:GrpB family protein [Macrococcus caseolyticus]MCE4957563.1 GrpB family protein [Macrococcus caseolyticus]
MKRNVVLPYDSIWQHLFIDESRKLKSSIKEHADSLQHIGSTAVPGSSAKPIIDMMIITKSIQLFETKHQALTNLGYQRVPSQFKDSLQYIKCISGDVTHQLFIFPMGHEKIIEMIAFTSYMKYYPSEMERYNHMKSELAKLYPFEIEAYQQAKVIFVTVMTVKALDWYLSLQHKNVSII